MCGAQLFILRKLISFYFVISEIQLIVFWVLFRDYAVLMLFI